MKQNTKDTETDWEAVFEEIDTECEMNTCINEESKPRRKYTEEELHRLAEMIRRA